MAQKEGGVVGGLDIRSPIRCPYGMGADCPLAENPERRRVDLTTPSKREIHYIPAAVGALLAAMVIAYRHFG